MLLLEAGPDHPGGDTPAQISGANFWAACAVPGRTCSELTAVHRQGQDPARYLRGRGVGGGSAVNAMVALRGVPADYDRWADELGCAGWAWSDVLPWLRRVEDDADFGGDDRGRLSRGWRSDQGRTAAGWLALARLINFYRDRRGSCSILICQPSPRSRRRGRRRPAGR
ncbi:MAG TPA: GMC family oxidoreductase N-terminal domain-containing protein [Pseudonocardia sp.]|uniref:GMC family oxidoreductase N-terminal domain-containing protein n=1 Tax=Pseudonocardia sp. TaxID=60912 RepID=UPI002F3FF5E2